MADELLGRADEMTAARRFLADAATGPASLIIEGEPGIGKSALWRTILADAGVGGRVLKSRPSELEASLSYATLTDLLQPVADEIRPILPPPQRRALDTVLLTADPHAGQGDLRATGMALRSALRHLSSRGPVIVAVDDVQWADAASARALSFAVRRLESERVGFLVSTRSQHVSPVVAEIKRAFFGGRLDVLTLGPMSLGALHRLIETRFGVTLPRPSLVHLERASRGVPLFALDIVDALRRADRPLTPEAIVPVPLDMDRAVARRLDAVPAATRDALLAVAALGRPRLDLLRSVIGKRDVRGLLAPAIDEGLIELEGDQVSFVHPLYRSAVYGGEPADGRHGLHQRIAEVLPDPDDAALHRALSAAGPDAGIANAVADQAAIVHRRGALDGAAVLYGHALRLTPIDDAESLVDRMLAQARILWELGDIEQSRALTADALALAPSGPARALGLLLEGMHLLWRAGAVAAIPVYEKALGIAEGDAVLEATIHLRIAYAADHDLSLAATHARAAAALLIGLTGADDLIACALLMSVELDLMAGRPYDAPAAARGRSLLAKSEPMADPRVPFDARAVARERSWLLRAATDDLVGARRELEEVRRRDAAHGLDRAAPITCMDLAELSCQMGDIKSARTLAEEATQLAMQTGSLPYAAAAARYAAALVAEHTGEMDLAGRIVREAQESGDGLGPSPLLDRTMTLAGRLELAQNRPGAAAELFLAVDAQHTATGLRHPVAGRFRGDLIESLVTAGRVDEAAERASRFTAEVEAAPTPWGRAIAARSRGLVAAASADLDRAQRELETALTYHEHLPMPVELGRTLLHLGRVRRRRRQKRSAAQTLTAALDAFTTAGAGRWAAEARRELERVGSRSSSVDELTATEREVARLAASGMTNRQVADAMVLSSKSVDGVLTRVYAKLDIHSRAELGSWIARESTRTEG